MDINKSNNSHTPLIDCLSRRKLLLTGAAIGAGNLLGADYGLAKDQL